MVSIHGRSECDIPFDRCIDCQMVAGIHKTDKKRRSESRKDRDGNSTVEQGSDERSGWDGY